MMTTASTEPRPGFFARLLGRGEDNRASLYAAVVAEARRPEWYSQAAIPDTIDGRFDVVTLVLSLVLLRLEAAGHERAAVRVTERFIDDMDGQIREIGFGDLSVGKQVGGIMSLLGGRLGAYRAGLDRTTLERTLWRGAVPADEVADAAVTRIVALRDRIDTVPLGNLLAGRLQ